MAHDPKHDAEQPRYTKAIERLLLYAYITLAFVAVTIVFAWASHFAGYW